MILVDHVLQCLRAGTVPADAFAKDACLALSKIFAEFRVYASSVNEPISIHVCIDMEGRAMTHLHKVWFGVGVTALVQSDADSYTADFVGTKMVRSNDRMAVHVAFTRLVEYNCPTCKETFRSEVNYERCKASHIHRKKPRDRGMLRVADLVDHWDSLDAAARQALAQTAARFLRGVDRAIILSERVLRVVEVAAGKTDLTGQQLVVGLDEASEYTFMYRMHSPPVLPVPYTTGDHVAAIADALVTALARAQAEAASAELLRAEELEAARVARVKEAQRMRRVEKIVWRTPMCSGAWADQD